VLFGPGTVPVTGLVGAELAGELTGEVTAGSLAVVPMVSVQAARANSAPAAGMTSDSFLIIMVPPLYFYLKLQR
jgi:hypothetical protein